MKAKTNSIIPNHTPKTLVLHAPEYQVTMNSKRSFSQTIATGIGDHYALNCNILPQAQNAKTVIILDKTSRQKATGDITRIVPTNSITGNGIRRFDIHVANLRECEYKPERLNRNGVAIV
jgi:hypothetical protein